MDVPTADRTETTPLASHMTTPETIGLAPSTSDIASRRSRVPRWVQAVGVVGTVVIASGAFCLSFTALTRLALMAGVPDWQAWAWPVIVDGLIVVATISVVTMTGRRQAWYPWLLLIAAAAVSVTGNAIHAILPTGTRMPSALAATVAAVPPVVLLAVTHLAAILTRPAEAPRHDGCAVTAPGMTRATTGPAVNPPASRPAAHGMPAALSVPSRSRHSVTPGAGDTPEPHGDDDWDRPSVVRPSPMRFLMGFLAAAGGTARAAEVIAAGAGHGYTATQLKDARRRASPPIISVKDGVTGGWIWSLNTAFEGGNT